MKKISYSIYILLPLKKTQLLGLFLGIDFSNVDQLGHSCINVLGVCLDDFAQHSTITHPSESQEHEHTQAATGGSCEYRAWATHNETKGVGRRGNQIPWRGSDCWKNPVNVCEEFIGFEQLSGLSRALWSAIEEIGFNCGWGGGGMHSIPVYHL